MGGRPVSRIAGEFTGYVSLFCDAPEPERPPAGSLRNHLISLLETVAREAEQDQRSKEEVEEIKFALVAWADERIIGSGWLGTAEWQREPLQLVLFGINVAGRDFYRHLESLPAAFDAAREAFYLALILGFQGELVADPEQRDHLIRTQFEELRQVQRAVRLSDQRELAPAAYELDITLRSRRGRRVWPRLLLMALGAGVVFAALWTLLYFAAGSVPVPSAVLS